MIRLDITKVLFLDIETVCEKKDFSELSDAMQELWKKKALRILKKDEEEVAGTDEVGNLYKERAAIYSEFGKIVCISVGFLLRDKNKKLSIRLKSFADRDEATLLKQFAELLSQHYKDLHNQYLCGHNIKEFDIPYICRRMLIHQIKLPPMLQLYGKKPWETKHLLDTMNMWKFGDYKNYTSLKLLAAVLGFPSPKDDIDGSEVGGVFWDDDDLDRIAVYCEKDVLATAQLLLRLLYMPLLEEDQITFLGQESD